METTLIPGDLTLGRHFTAGGSVRVTDRLTVGGSLTVKGLLKARNIQGPCKGLFPSAEQLAELFPDPAPGWWALVGKSLPALVFVASDGRWTSTGGSGGLESPDLTDCNLRLDRMDTVTENLSGRVTTAEGEIRRLDGTCAALESTDLKLEERITDTAGRLDEIDAHVIDRRPLATPICILDPCGNVATSPLFRRSNFSGFAHQAGEIRGSADTLEIPVLAADWEGNTTPLTSLLVVMREEDYTGKIIFHRLISFDPVAPGETATLTLSLGDSPVRLAGKIWIEFRFDAPCTLYMSESLSDATLPSGRYYMAGRQEITYIGREPEPPRPWQYIRYRLLYSGGSALTLSDTVVQDLRARLDLASTLPESPNPETPAAPAAAGVPSLRLPQRFYAVEGDTLQIFYRGMICDTLVAPHRPMLQGQRGHAYPRYWEYTPETGAAGECPLKLALRDAGGKDTATASTTLVTVPRPVSPATPLHVACIGDSLTSPGIWPCEVSRRLCSSGGSPAGLGLTGIRFFGDKQRDSVGWTGYGGWRWTSYLGAGVSSGGGAAGEITLTVNPLYDSAAGKVSFAGFAETHCEGRIDVVYAMMGWNELSSVSRDLSTVMADVRKFARALHADFPQARLRLMGIPLPSVTGGMGYSYGAEGGRYADTVGMTHIAHRLNAAYAALTQEAEFAPYTAYVETAAQVDTENVMPGLQKPVNTRSTATELLGSNGVHPTSEGYLQIADAVYRDLCALLAGTA